MSRRSSMLRPTERLLRIALGSAQAATVLGDLQEELDARIATGQAPTFPRIWLLGHAAALAAAACWTSVPRVIRAAGYSMRDAIRGLRASPRTTALAILILTLGMSAATVTFSVVDHVVLRPLPFPDDHRLVAVYGTTSRGRTRIVSPQDYFAFRAGVPAFEHVAAWTAGGTSTVRIGDIVEEVPALVATASLFDVLRVRPMIGRSFGPDHERSGGPKAVVLSHAFWQRRFGADPSIAGRTIVVEGNVHEILGVMPPGAEFPIGVAEPAEIWRPYVPRPQDVAYLRGQGRAWFLQVLARLRDDATIEQAATQVDAATAALAAQHAFYGQWRARVDWLRDALVVDVRGWMLLVLGAVSLVLAVACVNVANLQLARSAVRARDFAVRASLGATRGQLVHAMLVESLLLSVIAGAAGLLVSVWALDVVKSALPDGISRASQIALDGRIAAAAFAAAAMSGIVFGIVPAWQASRTDIIGILKAGTSAASGPARRTWRSGLLIAQVGLMVVLLVATSLLVASFVRIMGADLGFARTNLVGIRVFPVWRGLTAADRSSRSRELFRQSKLALEAVPGVAHVGYLAGAELPLHDTSATMNLQRPGGPDASAPLEVEFRRASEDYLEAAGLRVVDGRWLRETDRDTAVVVLDQIAAARLFGASSAVGRTVLVGDAPAQVIGVVSTVRFEGPEDDPRPQIHLPWSLQGAQGGSPMIVVRTSRPPSEVVPAMSTALTPLLPAGSPPTLITVMDDLYRELTADRRFAAGLMTAFGVLALLIGAAGIYSVMSSIVALQTREIGIRCALGATRSRIASLVLSEAGRHVAVGLAIGLAAAWAVSGIFASLVFGVTPTEPALYLIVVAVLALVALAAAWLPARRAARVDPIVALRE